ncbi:MAG: hypothetical protein GXO10_06385 [Crenarchaeota archaeon]|nr:hypothetical protein [Thermoproteota archaeon]
MKFYWRDQRGIALSYSALLVLAISIIVTALVFIHYAKPLIEVSHSLARGDYCKILKTRLLHYLPLDIDVPYRVATCRIVILSRDFTLEGYLLSEVYVGARYGKCIDEPYVRNGLTVYSCIRDRTCIVQVLPLIDPSSRRIRLVLVEDAVHPLKPSYTTSISVRDPTIILDCESRIIRLRGSWNLTLVVYG